MTYQRCINHYLEEKKKEWQFSNFLVLGSFHFLKNYESFQTILFMWVVSIGICLLKTKTEHFKKYLSIHFKTPIVNHFANIKIFYEN